MCANTGGPCKTINRPLNQAHAGLGITEKEFKIPQKEYDELMIKVGSLRDYVVEARIKK